MNAPGKELNRSLAEKGLSWMRLTSDSIDTPKIDRAFSLLCAGFRLSYLPLCPDNRVLIAISYNCWQYS